MTEENRCDRMRSISTKCDQFRPHKHVIASTNYDTTRTDPKRSPQNGPTMLTELARPINYRQEEDRTEPRIVCRCPHRALDSIGCRMRGRIRCECGLTQSRERGSQPEIDRSQISMGREVLRGSQDEVFLFAELWIYRCTR
ncbi:unnamed protein product [Mycena citricolor]|uniref:Uncharacterized protein n=1 Tax=Mycena citricolor TaxID=2018698 RepID=A0AAD2HXS9_9AGAR|nr:unnamed protein product [Mycena citricolor]